MAEEVHGEQQRRPPLARLGRVVLWQMELPITGKVGMAGVSPGCPTKQANTATHASLPLTPLAASESSLRVKAAGLEAASALAWRHEAGKVALLVAGTASAALPVLESVGGTAGEAEEESVAACCTLLTALTCADDDTLPSSRHDCEDGSGVLQCCACAVCAVAMQRSSAQTGRMEQRLHPWNAANSTVLTQTRPE